MRISAGWYKFGHSAQPRAHAGLSRQDATFPFHDGARPRAAHLLAEFSLRGRREGEAAILMLSVGLLPSPA